MQKKDKRLDGHATYIIMVINEALNKLLNEKHLLQITVGEICEIADINRAIFHIDFMVIMVFISK